MIDYPLWFVSTAMVAFCGVYLFRRVAIRFSLVDTPNSRSSHEGSIPRGAGVVFLACYSAALLVLFTNNELELKDQLVAYLCVLVIGITGFIDDLYDLSSVTRFLIYLVCSILAVVSLTYGDSGLSIEFTLLLVILSILMTAVINAFNFMDGINGIAGFETLFILLAATFIAGHEYPALLLVLVVAGSVIGFLFWNFPVAAVFMGDAGSTFLGAFVFVWLLDLSLEGTLHWATGLILGAVYLSDTGYTLAYRMFSGLRWFAAHRSHAYQILARRPGGHNSVVLILTIVNIGALLPLAVLLNSGSLGSVTALGLAYIPLLLMVHHTGAGRPGK